MPPADGILINLDSSTHRRRTGNTARAVWLAARVLALAARETRGQSLLLRGADPELPPIVQFSPPRGRQEAAPQPATIDAALSVVFDDFVFDGPQARTLRAGLAALFGKGRRDSMEFVALAPRSEEHTSELQSPCNLVC